MADPIREAAGSAPSSPAIATPAPEPFEPDEPPWPEILAAGGRVSDDAVGDYLCRLGRYALLTAEQEVDLAQEIEAGLFAEQLLADGRQRHGDEVAELQTIVLLEGVPPTRCSTPISGWWSRSPSTSPAGDSTFRT